MGARKFRYCWYRDVYDAAVALADIAHKAAAVDDQSLSLRYEGACEVWMAVADLMRSLDALRVPPSYVGREVRDAASLLLRRLPADDSRVDDVEGPNV